VQGYRASAERAAILFFVLNDMGTIDPMYQFALDAYTDLYGLSIEKSQRSPKLEERINNLNEYHTYAVYRYCSKGVYMCIVKMFFSVAVFHAPYTHTHTSLKDFRGLCVCVLITTVGRAEMAGPIKMLLAAHFIIVIIFFKPR